MEMLYMEPEENFEIPGLDMEGQEAPPHFVEINYPDIPQDQSLISPEVPDEIDGPTQVSTPATEGPRRSTIVRSQPDVYAPSMRSKRYEYAMTQQKSQVVLHPDVHMFAHEYFYQDEPEVVIAIMTQLSFNAGLKEWVEKEHSSANSDMKQLHIRITFIPIHRRDLTHEECHMVLESHMFLKNRLDRNIKVHTVYGGNKQCTYIPKENSSSPTIIT